jgi:oxygen-independent coproporphyrinogen-3 oxidase
MRAGIQLSKLSLAQVEQLQVFSDNGYLSTHENHIVLTPTGRLIADRIVREITI